MQNPLTDTIDRTTALGGPVEGYYVTLQHGMPYFVTAGDSNIIRLDMPFAPSGQWRAIAVYSIRGGHWVRLCDWHAFAQLYASGNGKPMTYKNGKPIYHIGDFDHGSDRIQGDGMIRISRIRMSRKPDGTWWGAV